MSKVAIYIISDGIGGAEQVVWQTINALKDQSGIFLIVNNEIADFYSTLLETNKILNIGSIYLHRNPSYRPVRYLLNNRFFSIKPLLVRSKTRMVSRFLEDNGIRTVHSHMEFALYSALEIKKHFNALKVIYTVHSAFGFLNDKLLKPQHSISRNDFSNVDILIFVSKYNFNLFRSNNVLIRDYRIIYNSINISSLSDKVRVKPVTSLFNILYLGGAKYVKGFDLLVATVKKLISDFNVKNLKITILGHVPAECEFINLINENGLSTYFDFKGFIVPPAHYKYFQESNLLFMPSRSEAMPMAAVEALFFDLPVVASNVGGFSEIISNGKNGYLCIPDPSEFAETIHRSIGNYDQLLQSTTIYNESIREEFDSKVTMGQLSKLYSELT